MLISSETLLGQSPPHSRYLEAYRRLRTALSAMREQKPFHSLLITSASPNEGKTVTTLNLGVLMAQTGIRVIVVDCDFAHPAVEGAWSLKSAPGLTDICVGKATVDEVLQPTEMELLQAVSAGSMASNGADLASRESMREAIIGIGAKCDLVLLDSAPVLGYAGTLQLARMVDACVLVARARGQVAPIRQALKMLKDIDREVGGVIVNDVLEQDAQMHPYYYYGDVSRTDVN